MRPQDHGEEEQLFARYLREGDCVVDVGANIGSVTLTAASRIGPQGSVYAFEPHPRIFGYLKENIAMNGFRNVHAFNLAVGRCEENVPISDSRTDDQNAIIQHGPGIPVPMRPLDAMRIGEPVIHLLKIDTEGYEKFVLLGASKLLQKTLAVYFESWDQTFAKYGYHTREVFRLLKDAGFCVFKFYDCALWPISERYNSTQVENLLAYGHRSISWSGRIFVARKAWAKTFIERVDDNSVKLLLKSGDRLHRNLRRRRLPPC